MLTNPLLEFIKEQKEDDPCASTLNSSDVPNSLKLSQPTPPSIEPLCGEACSVSVSTLRLDHYPTHQYNQTSHESLGKETPWSRFHNDRKKLRFVENQQTLDNAFVLHEKRHVAGDNIVSIDPIHYEMPREHASWLGLDMAISVASTTPTFHLNVLTVAFISLTDDMVVSYFNSAAELMLNQ